MECKLCQGPVEPSVTRRLTRHDLPERELQFYRCQHCGLLFHTAFDAWSSEDAQNFYQYPKYVRYDPGSLTSRRDPRTHGLIHHVIKKFGLEKPRVLLHGNGLSVVPFQLYVEGFDVATSYSVFSCFDVSARLDKTFDLVTSIEVMEHWVDPIKELHEVYRYLPPGGVFCGSTCLSDGVSPTELAGNWHYLQSHAINGGHCTIWSRRALTLAADRLGFIDHTEVGPVPLRQAGFMPATSVFVMFQKV